MLFSMPRARTATKQVIGDPAKVRSLLLAASEKALVDLARRPVDDKYAALLHAASESYLAATKPQMF
jgi:hypothetical protein